MIIKGAINYTTYPPTGANYDNYFIGVQSVVIDSKNRLWVLDTGRVLQPNGVLVGAVYGGPKLIGIDLATDTIFQTIVFPVTVAYGDSYLNDVRFDLRPELTPSGKVRAFSNLPNYEKDMEGTYCTTLTPNIDSIWGMRLRFCLVGLNNISSIERDEASASFATLSKLRSLLGEHCSAYPWFFFQSSRERWMRASSILRNLSISGYLTDHADLYFIGCCLYYRLLN